MANIREYTSKQGIEPSGRAAASVANTGEGWASAYKNVGQKVGSAIAAAGEVAVDIKEKYVDQAEISKGAADATRQIDAITQQWQAIAKSADPNDASIYDKFMDDVVEPTLEKFTDSFSSKGGQAWANDQVIKMRNHFSSTARADVSSRAGVAAVMNAESSVGHLSNTAYTDPTSLDFALSTLKDTFSATKANLNLDADASAKFDATVRQKSAELVFAGLKGYADRNPAQFLKDLAGGKFDSYNEFLDAEDKIAIRNYGEQRQGASDEDARAAKVEAEKAQKAAISTAVVDTFSEFVAPAPDGSGFTVKPGWAGRLLQIASLPGAEQSDLTSASNAFKAIRDDSEKRISRKSDPYTLADFNDRLYLSDDDPNKLTLDDLYKARAPQPDGTPGTLSNEHFQYYRQAITGSARDPEKQMDRREFDQSIKGFAAFINNPGPLGQGSPEAIFRENEFRMQKWDEFQALRATGRTRGEALKGLFDDYQRYQISTDDTIAGLTATNGRTVPAPVVVAPELSYKPGETIEAYAERLRSGKKAPPRIPSTKEFDERFGE